MSTLLERARMCLWAAMHDEFFDDVSIFRLRACYSDDYGFSLHFALLHCPYWCRVGYAIAQGRMTKEDLYPVDDSDEDDYDDEDYYDDEDDYDEDDFLFYGEDPLLD